MTTEANEIAVEATAEKVPPFVRIAVSQRIAALKEDAAYFGEEPDPQFAGHVARLHQEREELQVWLTDQYRI